jgi:dihydropteroate synthase
MAASRKGTIGKACGSPPAAQRMAGTIAAHTIAQAGGAQILRAHDVPEAVQAARVADAVLAAREGNDANG